MTTETKTALIPYDEMERMAAAIAKSGLFGMKTPEQALALMCVAQAEGRHPGSVATEYHIIQGRPTLKADTMLARFQQAGGKVEWTSYTDECVAAVFTHPSGGSVEIDWTMQRAKAAGLATKDVWKQYQRQMLRARVICEGVRTIYPGVAIGIYTPEEVMDFELVKSVGPVTVDNTTGEVTPTPATRSRKPATRKPTAVATEPATQPAAQPAAKPAALANGNDHSKLLAAFKTLAIGQEALEFFLGDSGESKSMNDWTAADIETLKEIYRDKINEAKQAQQTKQEVVL